MFESVIRYSNSSVNEEIVQPRPLFHNAFDAAQSVNHCRVNWRGVRAPACSLIIICPAAASLLWNGTICYG